MENPSGQLQNSFAPLDSSLSIDAMTVMLIDDDKSHLNYYMQTLNKLCHSVFATNTEDALEQMSSSVPDLIILDIMLGTQSGFDLFQQLQNNSHLCDIPVVFLSSQEAGSYKSTGYMMGGIDYMDKSIPSEEFFYRIRSHLTFIKREHELKRQSYTDALTGIANRRSFDQQLNQSWRRCIRLKEEISLIILDIDHFSEYNNTYGLAQGDSCLREVAQALNQFGSRSDDVVARLGGEEFVVMLPECSADGASKLAQKMCNGIAKLTIEHMSSDVAKIVTVSAGVCTILPDKHKASLELLQQADQALYLAKSNGKNQYKTYFDVLLSK